MTGAQVAADLRAAAEVLRRDGWTREEYVTGSGDCCAVGALMKAVDPSVTQYVDLLDMGGAEKARVRQAAEALVALVVPSDLPSVWPDVPATRWNDEVARTADEVIAALEAAADAAEATS